MFKTKFLDDTTMKNLIEETKQDIRDLRESHFHFCPFEMNEQIGDTRKDKIKYFEDWLDKYSECTCGDFDLVIDKLEKIEGGLNYNSKEERLLYEQPIDNSDALHISCDDCKVWEELDSDQPRTQAHSFTFNYDTEKWKCNACEKIVGAKYI